MPSRPRPSRGILSAFRPTWITACGVLALVSLLEPGVGVPTRVGAQTAPNAQGPRPAQKDSSPRTKPKEVAVSASVSPSQARPGDVVTFTVTAKLNPGWHIYSYAKEQVGDGPRNTRFDLFDTTGLKPQGDWTASKPAIRKKEPAFPDIDAVEFYDEEVSWSIKLQVPSDAKPGPHALRCQASYQICDASRCSFPGRWTLPDATVTVGGADTAKVGEPSAAPAQVDATAKPRRKDSPPALRPKSVTVSARVEPAEAKPGDTVSYKVTAKLDPEWHIYDYAKEPPGEGPRPTTFDFFQTAGLELAGEWTADRPAEIKPEPAFDNLPVAYFENEVTWSIPLKLPAGLSEGSRTLRCQVGYMVCTASSCSPPGQWTLPDVVLKVTNAPAKLASQAESPPAAAPRGPIVGTPDELPVTREPVDTTGIQPAVPVNRGREPGSRPRVVSEVERTARQGILPLMVTSALGGLLALVMPCVWPMVPITVNFFVKQGQKSNGSTTGLAITYCLAIIGVFTAVGVLCSFFLSASALPTLANNPWLNFFVAGLFFAFGLSLLGLFEIRLPNALLNASARGESRGGLVGVMFMALTLTITSFTCTFPVVGGLLVMASRGQFFYPIIGLATFATVLALPFFLLALAPGLLSRVPKSGDWMNSVKVVGGLIEIGAAFKFLNTAELAWVTPENAWFDAQFVLTAWVVLAAVCGFYLLGFFRTDHDHEEVRVGPGRMVMGTGFLGLALFLAPALFGRPPQSLVWDRMVVGLLPPDWHELQSGTSGADALARGDGGATGESGSPGKTQEVHATSTDPDKAQREERRFHGVWWGFSYEEALEKAKAEGKPVLIDFTGVNCPNCRLMESNVLTKNEVVAVLKKFVTVQLYTAPQVPIPSLTLDQRSALGDKNAERQIDLTNDNTNPFYVVLSPDEKVVSTIGGYRSPAAFVDFLNGALGKFGPNGRVARTDP